VAVVGISEYPLKQGITHLSPCFPAFLGGTANADKALRKVFWMQPCTVNEEVKIRLISRCMKMESERL